MKIYRHIFAATGLMVLVAGCSLFRSPLPKYTLRFHEEAFGNEMPETRLRSVTVEHPYKKINIDPYPTLAERDIVKAELQPTSGGDVILVKFDAHGSSMLMEMTTRLRGHYYVVIVNDRPIAAVLCDKIITEGQIQVVGDISDEEAKGVVESLNKLSGRNRDLGDTRFTP